MRVIETEKRKTERDTDTKNHRDIKREICTFNIRVPPQIEREREREIDRERDIYREREKVKETL